MAYEHIEVRLENNLGTITLQRPPVNIMNIAMMEEINSVLQDWHTIRDLKVVLFNAQGKCFSAGVDVGEHMGDMATRMIDVFHSIFRSMDTLGVTTVASIHGSCLGGGCELAVYCDLVIASEDAKLGQPEIQVGVFPPLAALLFPRIMGRKAALELILSGKILSADQALQFGLVNSVVKTDELIQETEQFIKPYLKLSAEVLRLTRKAIFAGMKGDPDRALKDIEDIYLNELMKTEDATEGLSAFMEKRKPVWKNR